MRILALTSSGVFDNQILGISRGYQITTQKKETKMRKKIVTQRSLFDQAIHLLLSIFKPEKILKKMDTIIDENPDILETLHADLTGCLKPSAIPNAAGVCSATKASTRGGPCIAGLTSCGSSGCAISFGAENRTTTSATPSSCTG